MREDLCTHTHTSRIAHTHTHSERHTRTHTHTHTHRSRALAGLLELLRQSLVLLPQARDQRCPGLGLGVALEMQDLGEERGDGGGGFEGCMWWGFGAGLVCRNPIEVVQIPFSGASLPGRYTSDTTHISFAHGPRRRFRAP